MTSSAIVVGAANLADAVRGCDDSQRSFIEDVARTFSTISGTLVGADGAFEPVRMCLEASRLGRQLLFERGWKVEILGGDIVLAADESVEHFLILHETADGFVVVDYTASQLPWFSDDPAVAIIEGDAAALERVLRAEWRWWIPPFTSAS